MEPYSVRNKRSTPAGKARRQVAERLQSKHDDAREDARHQDDRRLARPAGERATDLVKKLRRYHQGGVPHYWILDQVDRTLTVHRHGPDGYLIALRAEASERVRAEPFAAVELPVGQLLGDDPD
jgi:hypothetical protein